MPSLWLFKEEPDKYSYDELEADGSTRWGGVRNNLALKHLRQARPGDQFLYYHTGKQRAVVGIGKITSDPYVDPDGDEERLVAVDVQPVRPLERPVTLAQLKSDSAFEGSPLVRMGRLSVVPITKTQWKRVLQLARA